MRQSISKDQWKVPIIEHGKPTKWNWVVLYPEGLKLGERVDIGAFSLIHAKHYVTICNYVKIGAGVKIYSESSIDDTIGTVWIQPCAKIGANSVIMPNVYIGDNVVIGALSFVPYGSILGDHGVYVGCPVRRVK